MFDYGGFWIKDKVWNNIFAYEERKQEERKIWVAPLEENWGIQEWTEPVFAEIDKNEVKFFHWLKNQSVFLLWEVPVYVFDNHNHALAFWYRELFNDQLKKWTKLIHIDQHSDMNENEYDINIETWEDVIEFVNEKCNVWNFILPAVRDWLVSEVKQLRTEQWLLCFEFPSYNYILDIDLDFWAPEMGISNKVATINQVKKLMKYAQVVTIATSPYFLDQKEAIWLVNQLLD